MFGALKPGFRSLATVKPVVNIVGAVALDSRRSMWRSVCCRAGLRNTEDMSTDHWSIYTAGLMWISTGNWLSGMITHWQ